jgi:hypothetical protein
VATIFLGGTFFSFAVIVNSHSQLRNILLSYLVWLFATRTLKLMPHLWNQPSHIIYVPAYILFGYYFAIMKVYALCTLHEVRLVSFSILNCTENQHRLDGALGLVSATFLQLQPLPIKLTLKKRIVNLASTTCLDWGVATIHIPRKMAELKGNPQISKVQRRLEASRPY